MARKNLRSAFAIFILTLFAFTPLPAIMNHPAVGLTVYCNPGEVPPGETLYGEAVVSNNNPVPLDFLLWGGVFDEDELVLEIEPFSGSINAWGEFLFPVPISVPMDLELGRYHVEMFVGPDPETVWRRAGRPFSVKYPPPVRATVEVMPGTIFPCMDIYANVLIGNMVEENLDFTYRGVVKHNDNIVAEIGEGSVFLEAGEHILVPVRVELPCDLLPGTYTVHLSLGQDEFVWCTERATFNVVQMSPVGLGLFVDPHRTQPGEIAWVSAILRNETEDIQEFKIWGTVTHRELLYMEFPPVRVSLEPGEEHLVTFPIHLVELAPLGMYRVRFATGPDVGRDWMASEVNFWVTGPARKS